MQFFTIQKHIGRLFEKEMYTHDISVVHWFNNRHADLVADDFDVIASHTHIYVAYRNERKRKTEELLEFVKDVEEILFLGIFMVAVRRSVGGCRMLDTVALLRTAEIVRVF